MAGTVAVPLALLMRLSERDHEERPAVVLERPPNHSLAVTKPGCVHGRTPAPPAVAPVAMNELPTARAELPVPRHRCGPDPGDDLFASPKCRPLLIRISRDDPPLALSPAGAFEREEPKWSVRLSPATHARPAASSAVQRFAADRQEAQKQGAPVRDLMRDHHRPRATAVRIRSAPLALRSARALVATARAIRL
jgi:hypothetical protein